jgi:hypothetical protein
MFIKIIEAYMRSKAANKNLFYLDPNNALDILTTGVCKTRIVSYKIHLYYT